MYGERIRHINFFSHKLFVPPFVPGIVPGTNWVCPRDKPGFAGLPLCKIRRKPGFVPGLKSPDKPGVVPRPTGQKSLCLCAFFLPDRRKGMTGAFQETFREPTGHSRGILEKSNSATANSHVLAGGGGGQTFFGARPPTPLLEGSERWDWSGRCPFPLRQMRGHGQMGGGSENVFGERSYGRCSPS